MSKKAFILYFIGFLICSSLLTPGCKIQEANKERKIQGTWKVINVIDKNDPPTERYWRFENGTYIVLDGDPPVEESRGEYAVEQKLTKAYVHIYYGIEAAGAQGAWLIHKLKKQKMVLILDEGGLYIKEFERAI